LSAIYELPFGSQRKFGQSWSGATNAVLGGWSVNTIFQAHTGLALTVIDLADQSLQEPHHGSVNFPNRVCNGAIPGAGVDDVWIDLNCYPRAPRGHFGDSGAGILYGPGYWNWDLGLGKDVYFMPDVF
jgi:hypothetical protein